jgi:hypothetical protein
LIFLALLAAVSLDATAISQNSATLNALGPHPFGSPRNQAAAQFVAAKLEEAGLTRTTLETFGAGGLEGTNVVANLPGRSDRLLIIATHHDSSEDAAEVSDRSRSLSLLIEIGRQANALDRKKTWILASFDGGEATGEGMAHYLEGLGKSRGLIDGVVLIEASPWGGAGDGPSIIVPACGAGDNGSSRGLAGRDLVSAALSGLPESANVSFADPGISLLTQPFIRAFKTPCDPGAGRAIRDQLGVILIADAPFSRQFISGSGVAPSEPPTRDDAAAHLGAVALAAIQGIDASTPSNPQSDSWLVVGRSVWPGWFVFLLGLGTLVPGLVALRAQGLRLWIRAAYSALFTIVLFFEPEIALFSFGITNLVPPSASAKARAVSLAPLALLSAAGIVEFFRGEVTGSWLSIWLWLGLIGCLILLFAAPRPGRKSGTRGKRSKR